jgi:hypothetical protein
MRESLQYSVISEDECSVLKTEYCRLITYSSLRIDSYSSFPQRLVKLLHLFVGVFVLVTFLLTGQYMDYLDVRSGALGETARMMFRSRHIYILLAGLVNLAVGAYFVERVGGWRRRLQLVGTVFIIVAPVLMLAAFFSEPGRAGLQRHFTLPAVIILSLGTLCHAFSGIRTRHTENFKQ